MKTQDEIVARVEEVRWREDDGVDLFGFRQEVLIGLLDYEHAKPFLKEDTTEDQWEPVLSEEAIRAEALSYYTFALDKMENHRGLSASRSVEKLGEYAWVLLGDEAYSLMMSQPYANYGAPIVKKFAELMDFGWPTLNEALDRMSRGQPCEPGCDMGCGKGFTLA